MDTATNQVANDALTNATADAAAQAAAEAKAPEPGSLEAELAALETQQAEADKAGVAALENGTAGSKTSNQDTQAGATGTDKTASDAAAHADPQVRAIIALRKQNQALSHKLAETTGAVRVLEHLVTNAGKPADDTGAPPDNTPQKPQSPTAEIDAKLMALAEQNELGNIDMPTYEKQRLELMDQRFELQMASRAPAQADAATVDTTVQDHLDKLLTEHPYIRTMNEVQLAPYQQKALQEMQQAGTAGKGNRADMELRDRMAALVRADRLRELGITEDPRKGASGGQPANNGVQQLSPQALAREAKLNAAGGHPADISKIGSGNNGLPTTSNDALATLNSFGGDEEAAIRWMKAHPEVENLR